MTDNNDLLIEIGTEELPPKALKRLAIAFADEIRTGLEKLELSHADVQWFATPRRLSVIVTELPAAQQDREVQKRGPALKAAFDDKGDPTKAAEGFARSCGVSVTELSRLETDKGTWLIFDTREVGKNTTELLEDLIRTALNRLPIPKRMRWGDGDAEFVRPVHWVLVLFGQSTVDCEIMGIKSDRFSYGHRFHYPDAMEISSPADYIPTLLDKGYVIADYEERKKRIREGLNSSAEELGNIAVIEDELLEEVTSLVEWPQIISGNFDSRFLELPDEALIASMQDHQKYFPMRTKNGELSSIFLTVANIESSNRDEIKKGNERVILPRLSDAEFFWKRDIAHQLEDNRERLKQVVYQKKLGSLFDKSERVEKLARHIAVQLATDEEQAARAAQLAKCDLMSDMVGEFPELQGVMGKYYALHSHEDSEVANALDEQYMPRYAGDSIPSGKVGQVLSIAEKLDTLLGIFAIGQIPSGDKDPFALRRAALGCLRVVIESELDLDLRSNIEFAARQFAEDLNAGNAVDAVIEFMMERLRRYYADAGVDSKVFMAVLETGTSQPLDFHQRIQAVQSFIQLEEAESLAGANKRIQNILRQSEQQSGDSVDNSLLQEAAEKTLFAAVEDAETALQPLLQKNDYVSALRNLAQLRSPIDSFFDGVMVMAEDDNVKNNRLALLRRIHSMFIQIADISLLQTK